MKYNPDDNQSWSWQDVDINMEADFDIDNISNMFDETTPIKACGDFAYQFGDCEIMSKTPQEGKEYASKIKRRRILDFNNANEETSSSFIKSKDRIDAYDVALNEMDVCIPEENLPISDEEFGESEAWLAECFNDTGLNSNPDDGDVHVISDAHADAKAEACETTKDSGSLKVLREVRSSRNIIFKGRKTFMQTPSDVSSSIVYPFEFVKPFAASGDMTIKDINQRIHSPQPSKSKQIDEETIYPTSAFSGKPVIGKTRIPIQGGKGSITIMRTKG